LDVFVEFLMLFSRSSCRKVKILFLCCNRYSEDTRPEVDQFYSNEPESPTIDRGGEKLFRNNNTLNSDLSSHLNSTVTQSANDSNKNTMVSTHGHCVNTKTSSGTDNEETFHYVDDYYAKDGLGKVQKVIGNSDLGVVKHKHSNEKVKVHRQMSDTAGGRVKVHGQTSDTGKETARRQLSDSEGGRVKLNGHSLEKSDKEKVLQTSGSQQHVVMTGSTDVMLGLAHYEAVQVGRLVQDYKL
jgi:hypothetical protein